MRLRVLANNFRILTLRNISHPLALIGMMVMYLSGIPIVLLLLLDALGFLDSPYIGILTFLVLPAFFALGALLVVLGRYRARRRMGGDGTRPLYPFPQWDLNQTADRARFLVVTAGGTLLLIMVATLSYRGVEFTESVTFCGKVCHTVMQPEHTAYLASPTPASPAWIATSGRAPTGTCAPSSPVCARSGPSPPATTPGRSPLPSTTCARRARPASSATGPRSSTATRCS
ncbi:MAG: hypothetical protein E4H17_01470 [Gemmatimonadales bacterium]|nr:MAG: hypothetical protein E4H17_01470 [Gemmatimonadales bacterium]